MWLHVYDLGAISKYFLNSWMPTSQGAFHVGIEVLGIEWCFQGKQNWQQDESGIIFHAPKQHPQHSFRESVYLGISPLRRCEVRKILMEQDKQWPVSSYHFVRHNCVDFVDHVHQLLQAPIPIPSWARGCSKGWLQLTPLAKGNPGVTEAGDLGTENSDVTLNFDRTFVPPRTQTALSVTTAMTASQVERSRFLVRLASGVHCAELQLFEQTTMQTGNSHLQAQSFGRLRGSRWARRGDKRSVECNQCYHFMMHIFCPSLLVL